MKPRIPRGAALPLALFALVVLSTIGGIAWMKLDTEQRLAIDDDRRMQALWLARSAAQVGKAGTLSVDAGGATLTVQTKLGRDGAQRLVTTEAKHPRAGTARVEAAFATDGTVARWTEAFERSP